MSNQISKNIEQRPGSDEPQAPRGIVLTDEMASASRSQEYRQEDRKGSSGSITDNPRKD